MAGGSTGLVFPSNGMYNSDIRLLWNGSNLLPRTSHTAIWKARYVKQAGYYAVTWHSHNDGSWHANSYEFGAHPYPTNGNVDSSGQSLGGTGSSGNEHYHEIAGTPGARDWIASPGPGKTIPLVTDVWVTQARTCEVVGGTTLRHTYWPDISRPDVFIRQEIPLSNLIAGGASAAFYFGASDWTASGSTNSETPSCTLRGLALFSAALSISDIAAEAASESNSAQTAAGRAAVWYINKNPTPSDVADKSGSGRNPLWANANRPGLYTA